MEKTKKIALLAIVVVLLVIAGIYLAVKPKKTEEGAKSSQVSISDKKEESKTANSGNAVPDASQVEESGVAADAGGSEGDGEAEEIDEVGDSEFDSEDISDLKGEVLDINARIKEIEIQIAAVKKSGKDVSDLNKKMEEIKGLASKAQSEIEIEKFSSALGITDQLNDKLVDLADAADEALGTEEEGDDAAAE